VALHKAVYDVTGSEAGTNIDAGVPWKAVAARLNREGVQRTEFQSSTRWCVLGQCNAPPHRGQRAIRSFRLRRLLLWTQLVSKKCIFATRMARVADVAFPFPKLGCSCELLLSVWTRGFFAVARALVSTWTHTLRSLVSPSAHTNSCPLFPHLRTQTAVFRTKGNTPPLSNASVAPTGHEHTVTANDVYHIAIVCFSGMVC
jgi:hypothetical protein